jgi:iron(III) transport system permease protein
VAALSLIPLGFIVVSAWTTGPAEAWDLLVRPRVGELLSNTVRLASATMLVCVVVGVGSAWLVERTDLPLRRLWHLLLVAPLAVPSFVNAFGWLTLTHRVEGFWGALMVVSLSYFPYVYLPTAAVLRGLDPALEECAESMGRGRLATALTVVVPQLRLALLGGALLVGLHLLGEFGAVQMLRFPTFTTAIYDTYQSSFNGPAATMTSGVLVLLCLILLTAELAARGRRIRYARVGSGAMRDARRVPLGWSALPVLAGLIGLVGLALGVPGYSLIRWLAHGSSTAFPWPELASAAGTSIGLGAAGAVVTLLLALPIAWLAVRFRGASSTVIERSTYLANALPGIVVALAFVTVAIHAARPLYQTYALLVIAYAVMFLPQAVVTVRAALEQAPPIFEDVSRSLGSGMVATARRVTLPLILPGLASAAALVFVAVVTELTATLLLAPIGTATLATQFWSETGSVQYGAAAPYALLMVIVSAPAALLLSRQTRRRSR